MSKIKPTSLIFSAAIVVVLVVIMFAKSPAENSGFAHTITNENGYTFTRLMYMSKEYKIAFSYDIEDIRNARPGYLEEWQSHLHPHLAQGNDMEAVLRALINERAGVLEYGEVKDLFIDGQPGKLILGASDTNAAIMIIQYPEPVLVENTEYQFVYFDTLKSVSEEIMKTFKFI